MISGKRNKQSKLNLLSKLSKLVTVSLTLLGMYHIGFAQPYKVSAWNIVGSLSVGRHHHQAAYIGNNEVLVIGGYTLSHGIMTGTVTNTTEIINYRTGEIRPGPSMLRSRCAFTVDTDPKGNLIVVGGTSWSEVEKFDVQTHKWSVIGSLKVPRWQHASYWISDTELLLVAGFDNETAEIFNTETGLSRQIASFISKANSVKTIAVGGRPASFWGFREGGPGSQRLPYSYRYDMNTDSWEQDLDMGYAVAWPAIASLEDGRVVCIGGTVSESPFVCSKNCVVVDDQGAHVYKNLVNLGRQHHGTIEFGKNTVLIAGGITDNLKYPTQCEFLDIDNLTSKKAPPLISAHAFSKLLRVPYDNTVAALIISGLDKGKNTQLVEILRPECETTVQSVPPSRFTLRGSAYLLDTTIVLTDSKPFLTGAAWLKQKVNVVNDFTIQFGFRLLDGTDNELRDGGPQGADGVALVFQPIEPAPLGDAGKGIGYDGIPHGLAIECDAFLNAAFSDPSGSHIAVQGGDGTRLRAVHAEPYLLALGYANVPNFVADGSEYHVKVTYANATLSVWVSKDQNFNDPVLSVPLNIPQLLQPFLATDGKAYAGITSATGFSQQQHVLTYVRVESCSDGLTSAELPESLPSSGVEVFPNPLYGQSTVRLRFSEPVLPGTVVEVYSRTGYLVLRRDVGNHTEIDLEFPDVASGVYAIRIVRNGELVNTALLHILR